MRTSMLSVAESCCGKLLPIGDIINVDNIAAAVAADHQ